MIDRIGPSLVSLRWSAPTSRNRYELPFAIAVIATLSELTAVPLSRSGHSRKVMCPLVRRHVEAALLAEELVVERHVDVDAVRTGFPAHTFGATAATSARPVTSSEQSHVRPSFPLLSERRGFVTRVATSHGGPPCQRPGFSLCRT